jgi:excisionase family DNA binding protein
MTTRNRPLTVPLEAATLYTTAEVAAFLKLNPVTVRSLIRSGDLAAISLGRGYRVKGADLEAYMTGRRVSHTLTTAPARPDRSSTSCERCWDTYGYECEIVDGLETRCPGGVCDVCDALVTEADGPVEA